MAGWPSPITGALTAQGDYERFKTLAFAVEDDGIASKCQMLATANTQRK